MRSFLRDEPIRGLGAVVAIGCLAGCVSAATSPGAGRYEDLPWYSGDECDQVRESDAEAGLGSKKREVAYDARLHVLHAVCERSKVGPRHRHDGEHSRADKITAFDGWKVHTHFEGQALDPIQTALFVVLVVDGPPGQQPDFGSRLKATFGLRRGMGELPSTPPEWEERPPPAYDLLHRKGVTRQRFANVVAGAQWEVASRSREAYDLRDRARSKNVDPAAENALLGGVPPVRFTRDHFLWNDEAYPRYSELLGARPRAR